MIVEYQYDSYGSIIDQYVLSGYQHILEHNTYTYRGYRYDSEISMYYLNSRYYNPEIGRFINADGLLKGSENVLAYNVLSYTENNPIRHKDECGYCLVDSYGNSINDDKAPMCNSLYDILPRNYVFNYNGVQDDKFIFQNVFGKYPYIEANFTSFYIITGFLSLASGGISLLLKSGAIALVSMGFGAASGGGVIYENYILDEPDLYSVQIYYHPINDISKIKFIYYKQVREGLDITYNIVGQKYVFVAGRVTKGFLEQLLGYYE